MFNIFSKPSPSLETAIQEKHPIDSIEKLLTSYEEDIDDLFKWALRVHFPPEFEVLDLLLRHGARLSQPVFELPDNINPFMYDPRWFGIDEIHYAAAWAEPRIVKRFIDAGAEANCICYGGPVLTTPVIENNDSGTGSVMRQKKIYSKSIGLTPLMHAAGDSKHEEVIKILVEAGGDVNGRSAVAGRTPLMWARKNKDYGDQKGLNVIKNLLSYGADVNAHDNDGMTALMHASAYDNGALIHALVTHGADIEAVDKKGNTALMYAVDSRCSCGGDTNVDVDGVLFERELRSYDDYSANQPRGNFGERVYEYYCGWSSPSAFWQLLNCGAKRGDISERIIQVENEHVPSGHERVSPADWKEKLKEIRSYL